MGYADRLVFEQHAQTQQFTTVKNGKKRRCTDRKQFTIHKNVNNC